MTEAEWLGCDDPRRMLGFIAASYRRLSERKLRLFACACAREVEDCTTREGCIPVAELAERYADGRADPTEVQAAADKVEYAAYGQVYAVGDAFGGPASVQWWDGATWTPPAAPPVDVIASGVACPSVDVCWFAGTEIGAYGLQAPAVARSIAGTWTSTVLHPTRAGWVDQVDCSSPSACLAAGENVQVGNGASWRVVEDLRSGARHQLWTDVSCPDAAFCLKRRHRHLGRAFLLEYAPCV